jgi:hypothetical protein
LFSPLDPRSDANPRVPYAFGWPSAVATLALGVAVAAAFLVQLSRRQEAVVPPLHGVWDSRAVDGPETTIRRITFTSELGGYWSERPEATPNLTPFDSAQFVVEGPSSNRLCIRSRVNSADCRVMVVSRDSLLMMFGTPTVARPTGENRWLFRPVR